MCALCIFKVSSFTGIFANMEYKTDKGTKCYDHCKRHIIIEENMIIFMKKVVPQCRIVAHIICHDSMQRDRKNTNKNNIFWRRLKVSGKSSLLYDTYPAVGRSRDLSERLLRHVPPAGNDYFCDLDADRTGLSWIYRIYFQQPEKTEKIIKNWYRQVLFHTADTSTFLSFYLFSKRRSARIHIACTMIAA